MSCYCACSFYYFLKEKILIFFESKDPSTACWNKICVGSPEQLISTIIINVNYLFVIRNERLTGKFLLFDELTFD